MISSATQADVMILIISTRKGEFETSFKKGGQTCEHVMLIKTAGVSKVVVIINKMDDSMVAWQKSCYDEIKDKIHQEKWFCYIADNMRATAIIAYIVLYSESHTLYSKYSAI